MSTDRREDIETWLVENKIEDVEVILPDYAGVGRGKTMPAQLFLSDMRNSGLRAPDSIFSMAVNGEFVDETVLGSVERDLLLQPVYETLVRLPWIENRRTASVICDAIYPNNEKPGFVPRQLLKNIVDKFTEHGWKPYTANEYEFYLLDNPKTIAEEPMAPRKKSGLRATSGDAYSLESVEEYSDFFGELYDTCELQKIEIDALVHEAGLAQFELNTRHSDPLSGADQAFHFKRALRQIAKRHGMTATFMAKPYPNDYGNSMHIHQSLVDIETGENLFSNARGGDSAMFKSYIGGLQKYLPAVMPMIAPYTNSYLRFGSEMSAPANVHWGYENRSVGLRVPFGSSNSKRVENRVPGSDVNAYFALAATLACGLLGIEQKLKPSKPLEDSAYDIKTRLLPRNFLAGLDAMERCKPIRDLFGDDFVSILSTIKKHEYLSEQQQLSPWEKSFLLTRV